MATGKSSFGAGHAWVGWIVKEKDGYRLLSHGRYASQKYFTATIVDPSSNQLILDYLIGIEAKALSDEKNYDLADLQYRVWRELGEKLKPEARLALLTTALQKNPYHRMVWLGVADATAAGILPRQSAQTQWDYLNTNFKEFPDFTFDMCQHFSKMLKTAQERMNFYEVTAKIFGGLRRQDLVAKLRLNEVAMLEEDGHKALAVQVAITGMQESTGEGPQGAELAKRAVALARELKNLPPIVQPLKTALSRTTPSFLKNANPHWVVMAELLRDVYKELGDTRNADLIQKQLDRVTPAGSK
jgi:hypothetical protein